MKALFVIDCGILRKASDTVGGKREHLILEWTDIHVFQDMSMLLVCKIAYLILNCYVGAFVLRMLICAGQEAGIF